MSYEATFLDGPLAGQTQPMGRSLPSDLVVYVKNGKTSWYHDDLEGVIASGQAAPDEAYYSLKAVHDETGEYGEIEFVTVTQRQFVTQGEPAEEPPAEEGT